MRRRLNEWHALAALTVGIATASAFGGDFIPILFALAASWLLEEADATTGAQNPIIRLRRRRPR